MRFTSGILRRLRSFLIAKSLQRYYSKQKIKPIGGLRKDLQKRNVKALRYINYVARNLVSVKGISELLREIALISQSGNEGERIYHNSLMELHAIYFVHNVLDFKILEVESRKNKIFSPFTKKDKSCDIKAEFQGSVYYFESKDASVEITTQHTLEDFIEFYPQFAGRRKMDLSEGKGSILKRCELLDMPGRSVGIC